MIFNELCKIATASGNARLVVSYNGDGKFAVGVSDGVTTPLVINGTQEEITAKLPEQLTSYQETIAKETAERQAKEAALKHEAEVKAAEVKLKQEESARKAAARREAEENKKAQDELSLF